VAFVVLLVLLVIGFNQNRDLKAQLQQAKAVAGTVATKFAPVGEAFTGQGVMLKSDQDGAAQAAVAQGTTLATTMVKQGNKVRAVFVSQGTVKAETVVDHPAVAPTPGANGAFSGVTLVQGRSSGPALTDVTLSYDPNGSLDQRLTGSWANYREEFTPTVVDWQRKTDKAMIGTFRLTRTVYKADGTKLGTEEIPLSSATSTFSPSDIPAPGVSRWTLAGGPVYDTLTHTYNPGIGIHYQITSQLGILPGIAGHQVFLWGSYTFAN
jgi:hypothetical protein